MFGRLWGSGLEGGKTRGSSLGPEAGILIGGEGESLTRVQGRGPRHVSGEDSVRSLRRSGRKREGPGEPGLGVLEEGVWATRVGWGLPVRGGVGGRSFKNNI